MPITVKYREQFWDVVCRKVPHQTGWYQVFLVHSQGKLPALVLGQVMIDRDGSWKAVGSDNPQNNWAAEGYATRRHAIYYLLRNAGYWNKGPT